MHSTAVRETGYIEIGEIPQWVQIRGDAAGILCCSFCMAGRVGRRW
jgi:hypothetical protein